VNKIRVKFKRGEQVKFLSHLDVMKVFERTLRRGNIPIAYSKGFNPHPQIVFGLPLGVGVVSYSEYADFEFSEVFDIHEFVDRMNQHLPKGFEIIDAKEKKAKENIMAAIEKANYQLLLEFDANNTEAIVNGKIREFLDKEEIMTEKKTKKGRKTINIRNLIETVSIMEVDGIEHKNDEKKYFKFNMLLSAGSNGNLKPEVFIKEFNNTFDIGCKLVKIIRTGLFIKRNGKLFDPLDNEIL
jgi:radical SAM-linked protein